MLRHTKIVATLGPASSTAEVLERMVQAGVDVVRMNFSHGTAEDHQARAVSIRAAAAKFGRTIGILGDLQGPKIRVGKLKAARSPWLSANPSSLTPSVRSAIRSAPGSITRICPKTSNPATSCTLMTAV